MLKGVDFVVTGEGKMDKQSIFGKAPSGIAKRCRKYGTKAVAIVGSMGEGAEEIYKYGIESIMPTVNKEMSLDEALSRAKELLAGAADRMFRFIKVGMEIKSNN